MTCLTCLDIEWLITNGETSPAAIGHRTVSRPGATDRRAQNSLYEHLQRHDRLDLWTDLTRKAGA